MTKKQFVRTLIELYREFVSEMVKAQKRGQGNYTDEDFSFEQFIRYLDANYFIDLNDK